MKTILSIIVKACGAKIAAIIISALATLKESLKYLNFIKKEKEEQKIKENNDELKDICDNGTLDDLIERDVK